MRTRRISFTLLAAAIACASLAGVPSRAQTRYTQTGIASYYAEDFHGKRTANGETFSMWAMTAAHLTLPFNTLVRVTSLESGKSVVVRINDAGPYKEGRIIDLSRGAAAKIGMTKAGTAMVRLEAIGEAPQTATEHVSRNEFYSIDLRRRSLKGFGIQLGSFADMDNLIRQVELLQKKGVADLYVQLGAVGGEEVNRLVLGGFPTRDAAEQELAGLKKKGVGGFVFQIR